MAFGPITVTFDDTQACVGTCCDVDPTCPPRMTDLWNAGTTLDVSITCSGACDCYAEATSPGTTACWPDTGTMPYDSGTARRWTSTGLTCNVGAMALECNGGNVELTFSSSACAVTITPTLIFSQNSPFMLIFEASSNYFGYCNLDEDLVTCLTEYTVTITITEP